MAKRTRSGRIYNVISSDCQLQKNYIITLASHPPRGSRRSGPMSLSEWLYSLPRDEGTAREREELRLEMLSEELATRERIIELKEQQLEARTNELLKNRSQFIHLLVNRN